ncbi:TPA: 3'-5' exonuclease, partial [Salmonella enterica]
NMKYMKVWGNGATFDNVILRGAYERAGKICPWPFWNDHDVRTLVTLGRSIGFDPKKDMPFIGEQHNALADARHQAKYVSAIWQKLIPTISNNL